MPIKPKRPCKYPNCPALVDTGYCERHKKDYNKSKRNQNEWVELYNTTRWRKASKMFLNEHPLCECNECKSLGRLVSSQVTDHKIPHRGNLELFWDESNWTAMSKKCHDRKTAKEDGGFGNKIK